MELTIDFIKERFNRFNAEYFSNRLVTPCFEISHCRRSLGDFRNARTYYRIRLSDYYVRSERDFEQTILHEMIHLYQSQTKSSDLKHGKTFKKVASFINNKGGWSISRTTKVERIINPKYADAVKAASTKRNMIVYKQKDDKYFIFASSAKHLDAWKRSLSKNHNISCFFIFKSDEIEFANFPSCRSRCRGKYISETETIRLLKKYNVPLHQNWDNSEQPLVSAV